MVHIRTPLRHLEFIPLLMYDTVGRVSMKDFKYEQVLSFLTGRS